MGKKLEIHSKKEAAKALSNEIIKSSNIVEEYWRRCRHTVENFLEEIFPMCIMSIGYFRKGGYGRKF